MLGEDHSLIREFPEYIDKINHLIKSESQFVLFNKKYTELDTKIRELELKNSPTSDQEMHELKVHRGQLKDKLLQLIKN